MKEEYALGEQLQTERDINQFFKILAKGQGLKGLADLAEELLRHPVSICDSSYTILAASARMQKMTYGLQQDESVLLLESSEIESLKRLHIEEQIYRTNRAFFIRTADHPDNNWIFAAIRIHNVMTGYAAVCLEADVEATDYELRIASALADACAIEMQKHDFFVTRSGLKYENFLIELLEGHFHDVNLISSRLELLDRKFCRFFCIIVFRCNEPHDSRIFNKRQMSILRETYPNSMSVVYQDDVVLFLNQDEPILFGDVFLTSIREFAFRNRMKAGFSQPFADILQIRPYYEQARNALHLGQAAYPGDTLYYASALLPQYLFSKTDYTGLQIGIHDHLHILQNHDEYNHTEFLATLRAFLENGRNATKAADALHIHRTTFFYRMKRIEELLEISITDRELLFLYELSFKIRDYLNGSCA